MNIRELAYKSLVRLEKEGKYSSLELDSAVKYHSLEGEEKAFFTRLLYGTTEMRITLDYVISLYSSKPVKRLDLSALIILRLGAYQLLYMDKIPVSAAVNESVKLASHYSSRSKGFINAVLRKISALGKEIPLPDKNESLVKYYSVKYSLPEEICKIWQRDYSEYGEDIYKFVNSSPQITLRVNTLKADINEVTDSLDGRCVTVNCAPYAIRLTENIPISELDLGSGRYFVQDFASQLAAEALDPKENQTVIDVCSCPGGKSFGAAIKMNNSGKIYSFDIHSSKLSLIESGAKRLGIKIIKTAERDATKPDESLFSLADRVICDVPCSGLGVVAKKSDLRYKELSGLSELCKLQYEILCQSSKYLKKGAVMVYSTCTLNKDENERNVEHFLSQHPDFSLVPFSSGDISCDGMLTLLPHRHNCDGFFIAKLIKN